MSRRISVAPDYRNTTIFFVLLLVGCAGLDQTEVPPDERYGHRYGEADLEGVEILEVAPSPDQPYFAYNLPIREVTVRIGSEVEEGETLEDTLDVSTGMPVDVLVEGALPDYCLELHDIAQSKAGRFIELNIQVRRLRQEACKQIRRPYRLYVTLDEELAPGSYTLRINGERYSFEVRNSSD